ncbi:MAG: nitroreductase family protein [Candidatus Actinomarina sp.]
MDVFEALYTTRAMRRVTEEPIPEEILKQMVDAAIRAPSGANNQGWKFIIVTESKIKNQLGDLYREAWDFYIKEYYENNPDMGASKVLDETKADQVVRISKSATWLSENFHKVPAQFVVLSRNDPSGSSIYPAIWNLMLAGRSHGIGTCLTTVLGMFNQEKTFDALNIPTDKGWRINAIVTAGYPLGKWGVAKRDPLEDVTFLNTWGNKPGWNLEEPLFNY